MKKNRLNDPLIIFGIALLLLLFNSYAPSGVKIFGLDIKQIDFLGDVRTDAYYEEENEDEYYEDEEYDEDSLNTSENDTAFFEGKPQYNLAEVINIDFVSDFFADELAKLSTISKVSSTATASYLSGNLTQLNKFFNALNNSHSKQVRIAHYGDSTIEGDLISEDSRDLFQKKFGGKGVGIVPIT